MADKKISELPLLSAVSGSTIVTPIVHDGTTVKIELAQLGNYTSQWSAKTGSSNTFSGTQTFSGNVNINGRLTVHEIFANYETASTTFSSGSNIFGDQLTDIHQFTGSTEFTGSLILNGSTIGFGELNSFTASQLAVNLGISSVTGSINTTTSSFDSVFLGISSVTGAMNTQSSSQDLVNRGISSVTGSINTTTSSFDSVFLGISSVTGAMNTQSSSQDLVNLQISSTTGSINTTTSSFDSVFLGISSVTGAINTTTSSFDSVFLGISSVTGAMNTQSSSQDLVNLGISSVTGSLIGITNELMAFTASLDNTYATDAQLYELYQATSSIHFTTQSLNTQTGSQDLVNLGISSVTGSLIGISNGVMDYTASLKAAAIVSSSTQIENYNKFALTASANTFYGTQTISGSLVVSGSQIRLEGTEYPIQIWHGAGNDDRKFNIGIGYAALASNTTGFANVAIGYRASFFSQAAVSNTVIGSTAAFSLSSGNYNTIVGAAAGTLLSTGASNTFLGHQAGYGMKTGSYNVSIGPNSGYFNNGSNNVTIGYQAGNYSSGSSNSNIYIGYYAGPQTQTTENNKLYINNAAGTPLIGGDFGVKTVTISGSLRAIGPITASVVSSSYVKFDSLPNGDAPSYQEGLLYYDNDMGALTFYNNEPDISLQIGQEVYVRAINKSGDDILNGTPVRVSGSQGDRVKIYKAEAFIHTGSYSDSSEAHNHILGIATHDILDDQTGYVTIAGLVKGLNTDIWDAGDILYVQTGSAGVLTNVAPPFPYDKIKVGIVGRKHPNVGEVLVLPKEPTHFGNITGLSGSLSAEVGDLWVYKPNNAWATSKVLEGNYEMIGLTASLFATNDVVSGSQQIEEYDVFALNSNLYTATGSLIGITNGLMAFTAALDNTYATDAQLYQLYQATASIQLATASLNLFTGSIQSEVNGIEAYTASLKNAFTIDGNNDVYFSGKITTQEVHTTYTTSSVLFQSGSTKFGNSSDDIHEFTGSKFEVFNSDTSGTMYAVVKNNRARNAAVKTTTTNGSFIAGTSIGTDTFQYQIYDEVEGVNRVTINSQGGTTLQGAVTASQTLTATKVAIGSTVTPTIPLEVYGQQKWFTTPGDGSELRGLFNPGGAADDAELTLYKADGTTAGVKITADGIDFSANANAAGMTSELLDDYEEGTWTPSWTSAGGTINTNSTFTIGRYTKIGNVVHIWARLYTNSVSSPTGEVTVSGLPFTVANTVTNQPMHLFTMNAINSTLTGTPVIFFQIGTSTATILNKIWDSTEFGGDIGNYFDNDTWGYFHASYTV